ILTNDAKLVETEEGYRIVGDPTEGALISLAGKAGMTTDDIANKYERIEELPFDSDRKMMTTFHNNFIEEKIVSFHKGAPDVIIDRCDYIYINNEVVPFTEELRNNALEANSTFAKSALRVLAYAYRAYDELPQEITTENIEDSMVFVGLS